MGPERSGYKKSDWLAVQLTQLQLPVLMSRQCCATLAIFKLPFTVKKSIEDYQFFNNIPLFSVKSNKVKEFVEKCKSLPFIWARLKIKIGDFEQKLAFFLEI